jgi:antitoxin component YwqK of YwqJK toxin-antitoxin module
MIDKNKYVHELYPNGNKYWEGYWYENTFKNNIWQWWYENGQRFSIESYHDCTRHGLFSDSGPNGRLIFSYYYEYGSQEGESIDIFW